MGLRCLIILATTICLYLMQFVAEGGKSKDILKTIKTEDGVYDCYDFYKQPAFNHPLLKNHSYHPEMRPSFVPKSPKTTEELHGEVSSIGTRLNCPKGTVPIRRLNYGEIQQMRRFNYSQLGEKHHSDQTSNSNTYFALGQSKSNLKKVYNGIETTLSIWNPKVESSQYSSGEIIIKGGSDVIVTGWTVNPMVYRDKETRFFIYTVAGDLHCFNAQCGFIHVRFDIPSDFKLTPISTVEGTKYVFPFFVYQDPLNGNWWLQTLVNTTVIGFWPQKIFRGLYQSATYVACGGEVSGPENLGNPPMGSGYRPKSSLPEWSYCKDVSVINEAYDNVFIDDLEPYTNKGDNYDVFYYHNVHKRYIMYGGPDRY